MNLVHSWPSLAADWLHGLVHCVDVRGVGQRDHDIAYGTRNNSNL